MLQFISNWLATDHDYLNTSYQRHMGHPAADVDQLRHDLDRFSFLLGIDDDGERLFRSEPEF